MIKPVTGMKVKLIRGDESATKGQPRLNTVHWIAGTVPVGSVGEVYEHVIYEWKKPDDPTRYMLALKFAGIEPKPGYCFGLSHYDLSTDEYEVVHEQANFVMARQSS